MLMRRQRVREYDGEIVREYGEKERKRKERDMCGGGERGRQLERERVEREKVRKGKSRKRQVKREGEKSNETEKLWIERSHMGRGGGE